MSSFVYLIYTHNWLALLFFVIGSITTVVGITIKSFEEGKI